MPFLTFVGGAVLCCVFVAGVAFIVEKLFKRIDTNSPNHKD